MWSVEQFDNVVLASYQNAPMNYLTGEGAEELGHLIDQWQDPNIRAVILTGAEPGRFITHYSVEELAELAADQARLKEIGTGLNEGYYDLLSSLRRLPKPVIAAMNGDTMGGGLELAFACDIRIATSGDYRIGLPEVRLGIIPGGSGTQELARLIGYGNAIEFVLRGRVVRPEEALGIGLVHEVVDDSRARALAIARDLSAESAVALAMAKKAVYEGADRSSLAEGLKVEAQASVTTLESQEGLRMLQEYVALPLDRRRGWLDRAQ